MADPIDALPPPLDPSKPADAALLSLLAHIAFADGTVDDDELAFLARVLPGRQPEALRTWARQAGGRPLNFDGIALALPTGEERWRALRFTVRMAWKDGSLAPEERDLLEDLCAALEMPEGALERVLAEVSGRGGATIDPDRILQAFQAMRWDAVDWAKGPVSGPLHKLAPLGAVGVVRVGLDGIEVLGLYREGIVASFREGDAFLAWRDIVTFTRFATLGSSVELHTEDGRRYTLLDFRLSGIGALLDRLFSGAPKKAGAAPVIHVVKSGDDD